MVSDAETYLIEDERLRSVFQHAPLTLSVTFLNAILTAVVLVPFGGRDRAAGWVGAILAVSVARWIGGRRFLRRPVDAASCRGWTLFSVLGSLTTGMLWGILAAALFPASPSHQFLLAFVIGGMCAGAVTVNAAHLSTVMAFILPASLPLAVMFLAEGTGFQVPGLMVIIFAAALSAISVTAHWTHGDQIRLRIALRREQRNLREANERLREEMAQRRTAEATLHQAQKTEAIGHLTGGMAHDFNNLLQVVIGNTNLIQRLSADNARVGKYARAAEQAAVRGAELTSALLTFARRQSLEALPVDINALLREFEPLLLRTLGATVRFEIVLAPGLPPCIADPAHFQSAVLNLVINARDAMSEGGVLSVTTASGTLKPADLNGNPDATPGDFVGVTVRDTGIGMSADLMAHIFEPFFTTKGVGKGSGLGLSQVFGFARQSGGHIELASAPDKGTAATLWLPVAPAGTALGHAAEAEPAGLAVSSGD